MSRQEVKLSEFVDVILGQTFREKAESDDGKIKLIQIKDIREGRITSLKELSNADIEEKKLKITLKQGDLLLPLRGSRYEASIFDVAPSCGIVTAVNQIAILRVKTNLIKNDYLLWFFNSDYGREALNKINTGTTIASINKSDLAALKIIVPNVDIQNKIIKVYHNWFEQKRVLNELIINGEKLMNRLCFDATSR